MTPAGHPTESRSVVAPAASPGVPTTAFFALPGQRRGMSLREAVAGFPESVFVDVLEGEDAYLLVVDVPGVSEETLEVSADGASLTVEGRREKDLPTDYRYVREDRSPFVDATVALPPDADPEAHDADLERGVLTLRVPKATADGSTVDVE